MGHAAYPGPLHDPSSDFPAIRLPLKTFDRDWYRVYRCAYGPIFFGRMVTYRFDAPEGEFGVLYMAQSHEAAFIETLGGVTRNAAVRNTLQRDDLGQRCWAVIRAARPLRLVDLTARGLARISADERLCAGDYDVSRRWAKAIYMHPQRPDGIYYRAYRARHDPSQHSVALFDRATRDVAARLDGSLLTDAALLARLLDRYGIDMID